MPIGDLCSFSVLVGGDVLPEHIYENSNYVEPDIFSAHGRKESRVDVVDGEVERQSFPVLPYELKIRLNDSAVDPHWAFVFIDGFQVRSFLLFPGEARIVRGFKESDSLREFLFSLPRFGQNESDIIDSNRHSAVGRIDVVMKAAVWSHSHFVYPNLSYNQTAKKRNSNVFIQATKRDAQTITHGRYLMLTTKAGRFMPWSRKVKSRPHLKQVYHVGEERESLKINYRLKGTLKGTLVKKESPVCIVLD